MRDEPSLWNEKNIHLVFELSLWLKGAFAVLEILAGVGAYFITQELLLSVVRWVTQEEFAEDPHDFIANTLLQSAQHFSIGAQNFAAIYLLAHGIIKLWLIVGLLRQKLWYYPVAIVVFVLFIVYQVYRYTFTHSLLLVLITLLDVIVIALTWHEYGYLRRVLAKV
jgi:uncharacterized membrane protein